MQSEFLKLNLKDFGKAAIIIVGTFIMFISGSLADGKLPELAIMQSLAIKSLVPGLVYIGKNLLTNANGGLLKKE
jgi:hypothetical protein